jgi:DeoR family transcriptional regulator, suf operon transcriptional repressor
MGPDLVPSDIAILDLLRKQERMTVTELAEALGVTATAVRQRLTRLMGQEFIHRRACREGRGRPSHHYSLTTKGRRKTGANFADLALALWQEIRAIDDLDVRRGLLQRISRRMAALYGGRMTGQTLAERMREFAGLMSERQIPFEVEQDEQDEALPVLHALACPYPELAEMDRSVCSMERMFLSEVLGEEVRLDRCRLDGDTCCTFEVKDASGAAAAGPPPAS